MRVAYLTSRYPAASHTFIRREVKALRGAGVDVRTYSVRTPDDNERASADTRQAFEETLYILPARPVVVLKSHGAALTRHPLVYLRTLRRALLHRVPGLRGLAKAIFYFAESVILADALRRDGVTHLHNHFANAAADVGRLAAFQLGIPWSLTLHGISETDYPAGLTLAAKIRDATFVACVSFYGMAQAMRITPHSHWSKMTVVRCGLILESMPFRDSGVSTSRLRVICVGRFSAEKGHLGLLEAFDRLRRDGLTAELVLVGDGPSYTAIRNQVEDRGLSDSVHFLGRCAEEETLRAIADSDLLVLPSFMEGLPVVLMEAMALGVPAIGPRVAGVPELVEDGVDGLLFTPGDWNDLRRKLHRLMLDAPLRERLTVAGRQKVEREFQAHESAMRLKGLFSSC